MLPELFCLGPAWQDDIGAAIESSNAALERMTCLLRDRPGLALCTSLLRSSTGKPVIAGALVGAQGLFCEQLQRQAAGAHREAVSVGSSLEIFDLPWARVAMLVGEEAIYPEYAKLAALAGAHVLAVPFALQEPWEVEYGLPSRAAENRVCVVAASRPRDGRAGLIADLERDFTIMTPWRERRFDGYINQPLITRQSPEVPVTSAVIHPAAAANKLMSQDTDLLADRPWRLSGDLVADNIASEIVDHA